MEQTLSPDILLLFKEMTGSFKEIKESFREIKELYKETDRQFKETDKKFQETDRQFKETDKKFQETDRQFKETDKQFKETDKKIGKLTNRLGEFIEEMVRPGAVRLFQERGIDVNQVSQNVILKRDNQVIEIDLLVVNGGELVAVECKSNLSIDDVNNHLNRLEKIKILSALYSKMRVMGAVAAMVIPENVSIYAYQKGLFVLCQSGDTMTILNDDKFKPKIW
ncbi:MAG: DUF3782 domain-containing protein [Desulfamplus sp.]|nr:DUF3782 domain-containing protein [Desulfamplus sp.]